ncbi:MAG: Dabb family protein [Isosphaeraceae bacterium]
MRTTLFLLADPRRGWVMGGLALVLAFWLTSSLVARVVPDPAPKAGPKLAHMVFFTLKERTPEAREKLIASCKKYLAEQAGAVFFAVGAIAEDVEEPGVSVRDFDVALHVVFEDKAAEARYLVDPKHVKFVEENKESFAKVRVFDSYLK